MTDPEKIEEFEEPTGRVDDFDLIALSNTRVGFRIAGYGLLAVLVSVPWFDVYALDLVLTIVRIVGWILIAAGMAMMAPTPNGPLPRWMQAIYILLCSLAALRMIARGFELLAPIVELEQKLVPVLWVAFLALPWILWRFCQYRGLTGRALTWLWSAVLLVVVFGLHWRIQANWLMWAYPVLGVLLFVLSKQTARDLWLDAVNRRSKAVLRAQQA
ncbi:MAG: hypothetical protein L6Q99_04140 [Planctomycetes bacterium]|nr:hypothetical protein [Planctomycetota bacterium]